MLVLFEDHLKRIAIDPSDDFHFQMRGRIGKRATLILEKRLREAILLMPKLLSRTYKHCRLEVPSEIKKLVEFALTYFYHPLNVLPGKKDKLFGYLDDAYFIVLAYEKILKVLSRHQKIQLSVFDRRFLSHFQLLKKSVEGVIPVEAEKVSKFINRRLVGKGTQTNQPKGVQHEYSAS